MELNKTKYSKLYAGIVKIIQKDATKYSLFQSVNSPTYFKWYLHAPLGAHITLSTVLGINPFGAGIMCFLILAHPLYRM